MMRLTEQEKLRQYLFLEKIRHRHDALFFNELRRFFHEELILILALPEFGRENIYKLLEARRQRLQFLLTPLYGNCVSEFYSYNLGQKSIVDAYKISQDVISHRTRRIMESLKSDIKQAFQYGQMVKEKISALYSTNARAMRIAKTEVNTASNIGLYQSALSQGLQWKIWICSREDGVRHSHKLLEGDKIPIKEAHSNGLLFPGDPKVDVGHIINCRCFELYL